MKPWSERSIRKISSTIICTHQLKTATTEWQITHSFWVYGSLIYSSQHRLGFVIEQCCLCNRYTHIIIKCFINIVMIYCRDVYAKFGRTTISFKRINILFGQITTSFGWIIILFGRTTISFALNTIHLGGLLLHLGGLLFHLGGLLLHLGGLLFYLGGLIFHLARLKFYLGWLLFHLGGLLLHLSDYYFI